ncbi:unnamed protein product [Didymodactylos carnosus]|uniref:Reverse transcriptase/retrotransposon-derived protein RNase H-like domain-containing protein n=1 Tax=Didymodactylos carnosus TaxID=1234261 RepID=A0A814R6W8_9BILA|nr:unnamed protein product [Didymodactylos carnosus]CAF3892798.1 unnamed protein product [Didymodactylos carnosus]
MSNVNSITNMSPILSSVFRRYYRVFRINRRACPTFISSIEVFTAKQFEIKSTKCTTEQPKIDYLGHTITPLNDKINAILRLKEPRTLKETNHFLGALAWYRKFIPKFAEIAAPIHAVTNLTKKNRYKFKWQEQQSNSFYDLKEKLTAAPLLLQFPNDKYPLILSTDASNKGISGILRQEIDDQVYNIYYHSQVITEVEQNYDIIEKKALAIWQWFERMRTYQRTTNYSLYRSLPAMPYDEKRC